MLSRRHLFGASAAAVAVVALPVAVEAAAHPDAKLIDLGRQWAAAMTIKNAASGFGPDLAAAYSRVGEIEEQIVATPCSTMEGLKVKARVAKEVLYPTTSVDNDWRDTVGLSVVDAILNGGLN
ncbi:hypothetical protein QOZ96_003608 [Brevundimonas nasdae]|uniref:hypothetical protein n=1 Tax=Brevundimonas nasdae TaxID=172043 RepID=UPI0019142DAC|nr:hypothetical protein [Brevundimonas nasdae]MBK6024547.1 hypothetical protein [Brevundimonas nasdae]MDQ0453635.1 hypothetical protein [Brevundimonas nasdae]